MRGVSLFGPVSGADIQIAQIVTGATMAAFIAVSLVPRGHKHAARIKGVLIIAYLLFFCLYSGYVLLR
jgi:hypothetical protein